MGATTAPSDVQALAALKLQARRTWSAGDYDAIAEGIWAAGELIVRRVEVMPGERVLDVAAGTGNAAIRAAQAGASVTALDLTPELFDAGRRRAAEAGVEIEWVAGDAEELPFADGSFDVVLSTFGVMFAPRHEVAAAEIGRVLRPGGRIGLTTWPPEGVVADVFATVGRHLPPPPEIAAPPLLWGSEEHVRRIFAGTGIQLSLERELIPIDPDLDRTEAFEFYITTFGPLIKARELLEPEGRWQSVVDDLRPAVEAMVATPAEYLVVTGIKELE